MLMQALEAVNYLDDFPVYPGGHEFNYLDDIPEGLYSVLIPALVAADATLSIPPVSDSINNPNRGFGARGGGIAHNSRQGKKPLHILEQLLIRTNSKPWTCICSNLGAGTIRSCLFGSIAGSEG
jgi:hypothetical protein